MSKEGITEAQTMLRDAGFSPGEVDGIWGNRTRAALAEALRLASASPGAPAAPISEPLRNARTVLAIIGEGMQLLPAIRRTPEADQLLLTICGQEADFTHRWQVYDAKRPEAMGAARGLWQFERGGGVRGVLTHERTKTQAAEVCRMRNVAPTVDAVYNALHLDDTLAAAFARLLLWTDPRALPAVGEVEAAWQMYLRNWRPGAYTNGNTRQRAELRAKWDGYYATAMHTAKGTR